MIDPNAFAFTNGHIVASLQDAVPTGLTVDYGVISQMRVEAHVRPANIIDLQGGYLLPGFIDTQVNGGGGVLFNDNTTPAGIAAIGTAHAQFGTTGFMPTLISDDLSVINCAMRATEEAIEQNIPGVLGLHIEGPFISTQRKGIHDAAKFRTLDPESKALLKSLRHGKTLVTLAPEQCLPSDIAELVAAGVIVAGGHTNATYDVTRKAIAAGMSGFTHLFNAMSPLNHREPGVVGAALESDGSYCGLIMDGRHVHPAVLRITLHAKRLDRLMLVTDAMPTVGAKQKSFLLNGNWIHVANGVCEDSHGTLAGSDLDMATALRYAVNEVGMSVRDASRIASATPAQFLGFEQTFGVLAPGRAANMVWLSAELVVKNVWIDGVSVVSSKATIPELNTPQNA